MIFLDDDDRWRRLIWRHFIRNVKRDRGAVLYGNFQEIYEKRDSSPPLFIDQQSRKLGSIPFAQLYVKNFIPPNVVAYPRMTLREKRFDPHLKLIEDWDFLLNIAEDAEFEYRDIYGAMHHEDSDPSRQDQRNRQNSNFLLIDYLDIYRKWPDERGNQTTKATINVNSRYAVASGMALGLSANASPGISTPAQPSSSTSARTSRRLAMARLSFVFSDAFFEQLCRSERIPLVSELARVHVPGGCSSLRGPLDFEAVARARQ